MAIAIAVTPSSGTAVVTTFHVEASGLDDTNFSSYNASNVPTEPQLTYYFQFSEGGLVKGRSHVFSSDSSTGKAYWDSVIVPDAGSYTFSVHNASTGATLKSVGVTVS